MTKIVLNLDHCVLRFIWNLKFVIWNLINGILASIWTQTTKLSAARSDN